MIYVSILSYIFLLKPFIISNLLFIQEESSQSIVVPRTFDPAFKQLSREDEIKEIAKLLRQIDQKNGPKIEKIDDERLDEKSQMKWMNRWENNDKMMISRRQNQRINQESRHYVRHFCCCSFFSKFELISFRSYEKMKKKIISS